MGTNADAQLGIRPICRNKKEITNDFYLNLKKSIFYILNPRLFDISDWILILSNILVIYYAITQHFGIITVIWIYWFQSMIIGLFTIIKIISLKQFTTKSFRINNKPVEKNRAGKLKSIIVFSCVYGIFHLIYFIFIYFQTYENNIEQFKFSFIVIPLVIFLLNHLFSFIYNYREDSQKNKDIGEIISFPILRIIPIHLTIIFGWIFLSLFSEFGISLTIYVMILFLFFKTILDLFMHKVEHHKEEMIELLKKNTKEI